MADGTEDFSDDAEGADDTPLVKQLRAELKARDKALREAGDARREVAFLKAGIDTSTKLGALFAKSYEGDLSDLAALKAEAVELGLIKGETPAPAEEPERAPDNSARERSDLATGATADDGSGIDPRAVARGRAEEAIKRGATFDVAAGGMVAELARAAMDGDQRVIIRGNAY